MKPHEAWLANARRDLKAAQTLAAPGDPVLEVAFEHTLAAIEKALKGFLAFKAQPIIKTHDLALLLLKCSDLDGSFKALEEDVSRIDFPSTLLRYPQEGGPIEIDYSDANAAVVTAEKILAFVAEKIQ